MRPTAGGRRSTARCSGARRPTSNSTPRACGRAIARTSPTTCGRSRCGAAQATRISSSRRQRTSSAALSTGPACCCDATETWGFQGATKRDDQHLSVRRRRPLRRRAAADHRATSPAPTARSSCAPRASITRSTRTISRSTGSPGDPAGTGPTFQVVGIDPSKPGQLQLSRLLRGLSDRQGRRLAGPARLRIRAQRGISSSARSKGGVALHESRRRGGSSGSILLGRVSGRSIPIRSVPLDYGLFQPGVQG